VVLKSDAANVDAKRELQRIHKLEEQARFVHNLFLFFLF
jgi:hypothetical protein